MSEGEKCLLGLIQRELTATKEWEALIEWAVVPDAEATNRAADGWARKKRGRRGKITITLNYGEDK